MSSSLPKTILAWTTNFQAWIVGSAADPSNKNPRDYDVIVPYSEWGRASHLIPKDAKVNSFGGWKFYDEDYQCEIDVWPGELSFILLYYNAEWAWQPHYGKRFQVFDSEERNK